MADITITAASVQKVTTSYPATVWMNGTAGGTITAGQAVFFDPGDQKVRAAQATNTVFATMSPTVQVGIALNSASAGQAVQVAVDGLVNIGGTVVPGAVYVVSGAAAGGVAPSADLDASIATMYDVLLGIATTTGQLMLNPTVGGSINP